MTRSYCNLCGRDTNHDVIASEKQQHVESSNDEKFLCYDIYEMLKCLGCETVQMRVTGKHLEDDEPWVLRYPRSIARRAPEWLERFSFDGLDIPNSVLCLIRETYTAAHNELHRLAAMGIRAALENVMREKVGDRGSFKALIDEFQKAGYLSIRQAGTLDSLLEAGHATIHRGWEPTGEDIATLLDITETIIETVYLHEWRAKALEDRVPKRPKPA